MLTCQLCDGQQYPGRSVQDWKRHMVAIHDGQPEPLTPQRWEAEAERLIVAAARTGAAFLVADVLAPLGEHPDPERRQFVNGKITSQVARDGWITYATDPAAQSTKAATKSSLVRRWIGTAKALGRVAA